MLGLSERTFRRWRDPVRDEAAPGLRDRRIGKPSGGGRGRSCACRGALATSRCCIFTSSCPNNHRSGELTRDEDST
jgi:hypothetical protein